jgi:hypothetical protein
MGCSATSRGSIYVSSSCAADGMIDESYWQPLQEQPVQLIICSVQLHQTINHSAKLNKTLYCMKKLGIELGQADEATAFVSLLE